MAYEEQVSFSSGSLSLEGVLTLPRDRPAKAGAVVFAPHPRYGGNMENNVVRGVTGVLGEVGFAVLRFNYRGIGGSARGELARDYWERVDDQEGYAAALDDGQAALDCLRHRLDDAAGVHAVGYSFGAVVAGRLTVSDRAPRSTVLIAPPLRHYDFSFLAEAKISHALVLGTRDFLYGDDEIDAQLAAAPPSRVDKIDADHYFRGTEAQVASRVLDFLEQESCH